MPPTYAEIKRVVESFQCLEYFPQAPAAQEAIMTLLAGMVGAVEQLAWLQSVMINRVGRWHGPAQLRALFCTRFPPADRIEGESCRISGFTPGDSESLSIAAASEQHYLPEPGDEPIGELSGEIESSVRRMW